MRAVILSAFVHVYASVAVGRPTPSQCWERMEDCPACTFHGEGARRLFITNVGDGFGLRVLHTLQGMAEAFLHGMNFGGIVGPHYEFVDGEDKEPQPRPCEVPPKNEGALDIHGVDYRAAMAELLGFCNIWVLYPLRSICSFNANYTCPDRNNCASSAESERETWNRRLYYRDMPLERLWTSTFIIRLRDQVRAALENRSKAFRPGSRTKVAIHARRFFMTGDEHHVGRFSEDKYFLDVVSLIRRSIPDADVHVWSVADRHSLGDIMDAFHAVNITVHWGGHVLDAWADFLSADIFVTSNSAFSIVPALFHTGCVLHRWHHPVATPSGENTQLPKVFYFAPSGDPSVFEAWVDPERSPDLAVECVERTKRRTTADRVDEL